MKPRVLNFEQFLKLLQELEQLGLITLIRQGDHPSQWRIEFSVDFRQVLIRYGDQLAQRLQSTDPQLAWLINLTSQQLRAEAECLSAYS